MVSFKELQTNFDEHSRFIFLHGNKILCSDSGDAWQPFSNENIPEIPSLEYEYYELGKFGRFHCHLIYFLDEWEPQSRFSWETVRGVILKGGLEGHTFNLVSTALQVQNWQRNHRFCGRCGEATTQHTSERAMYCEPCEINYYPRLSPCIITLITRGEYCLLAHNSQYKPGFYSSLAGFVEAGETLEQTLHREVMEEVGLKVKNLSYHGSQPWPFPSQLMVGFLAEYAGGEICVDGEEITDAQWWHYTSLPMVPPNTTISGALIEAFVNSCELNVKAHSDKNQMGDFVKGGGRV